MLNYYISSSENVSSGLGRHPGSLKWGKIRSNMDFANSFCKTEYGESPTVMPVLERYFIMPTVVAQDIATC